MILKDLTATVGKTPTVELSHLTKGLPGRVIAKLEAGHVITHHNSLLDGFAAGNCAIRVMPADQVVF